MAYVFWEVLDDSCRHFSNPLSPEVAQARYMDPKSVCLQGNTLCDMADKLACNKPLMNVSVPRQWLERGATAAAGISQWVLSVNIKVDGNHLRDIFHMSPKTKLSTLITWLSCRKMRHMDK